MEQKLMRSESNDFCCVICLQVLKNPVICRKCRCQLCWWCMDKWIEQRNQCPMRCKPSANTRIENLFIVPPQEFLWKFEQKHFDCPNADNGCPFMAKQSDMFAHLQSCEYVLFKCRSCQKEIRKKFIFDHLKLCPMIGFISTQEQFKNKQQSVSFQYLLTQKEIQYQSKLQQRDNEIQELNTNIEALNNMNEEMRQKINYLGTKAQFIYSKQNGFEHFTFQPQTTDIQETYNAYKELLKEDYQNLKRQLKNQFKEHKSKLMGETLQISHDVTKFISQQSPMRHKSTNHATNKNLNYNNFLLAPLNADSQIRKSPIRFHKKFKRLSDVQLIPHSQQLIDSEEIKTEQSKSINSINQDAPYEVSQSMNNSNGSATQSYFEIHTNAFKICMEGKQSMSIYQIQTLKLEDVVLKNQPIRVNMDIKEFNSGTFFFFTFAQDKKLSQLSKDFSIHLDNEVEYMDIIKSLEPGMKIELLITIQYEANQEDFILKVITHFSTFNKSFTATFQDISDMKNWLFTSLVIKLNGDQSQKKTDLRIQIESD